MQHDGIKFLPLEWVSRYKKWKFSHYIDNKSWYQKLAKEGQNPKALLISCCDSRVNAGTIFGANDGEFFIHRNIANLVPPFKADNEFHGTSAAVEYAVVNLKVPHIIILGHSGCGGIRGGYTLHSEKTDLSAESSFVSHWLDILRPAFKRVSIQAQDNHESKISELEKQSILVSIENLFTFPFVLDAVESDRLALHGLWHDIGEGKLLVYDPSSGEFVDP